jgi:predicted nucleic acid-binding protein
MARTALGTFDEWRRRSTTRRLTSAGDIAACERLVRRFELRLQAPDALHIAIALADGATLVTFDERQAQAMRQLGECVVPG